MSEALLISLKITAVFVLFQQGNLLGCLRIGLANRIDKAFGKKASRYVQKPLWDCLPCMASVWTLIFCSKGLSQMNVLTIGNLMLVVCGINYLIDVFISNEGNIRET